MIVARFAGACFASLFEFECAAACSRKIRSPPLLPRAEPCAGALSARCLPPTPPPRRAQPPPPCLLPGSRLPRAFSPRGRAVRRPACLRRQLLFCHRIFSPFPRRRLRRGGCCGSLSSLRRFGSRRTPAIPRKALYIFPKWSRDGGVSAASAPQNSPPLRIRRRNSPRTFRRIPYWPKSRPNFPHNLRRPNRTTFPRHNRFRRRHRAFFPVCRGSRLSGAWWIEAFPYHPQTILVFPQ